MSENILQIQPGKTDIKPVVEPVILWNRMMPNIFKRNGEVKTAPTILRKNRTFRNMMKDYLRISKNIETCLASKDAKDCKLNIISVGVTYTIEGIYLKGFVNGDLLMDVIGAGWHVMVS